MWYSALWKVCVCVYVCIAVCRDLGPHRGTWSCRASRFLFPQLQMSRKMGLEFLSPVPTCLPAFLHRCIGGWRRSLSLPLPWMKWELSRPFFPFRKAHLTWGAATISAFDCALFCQPQSQNWSYETRRIWIKLFIEVLFKIALIWRQLQRQSTGKWISKLL